MINYERELARFRDGGARAEPEVDRLASRIMVQEAKRELSARVFDDARAIFSEKEELFALSGQYRCLVLAGLCRRYLRWRSSLPRFQSLTQTLCIYHYH